MTALADLLSALDAMLASVNRMIAAAPAHTGADRRQS